MRMYGQINAGGFPQEGPDPASRPFDPGDSLALRRAMGRFATGVALVTTRTDHGPLGMTINSFASVSLDPPLVLWSAARHSKRHDAFVQAPQFCIQVLSAAQRAVATHFGAQGHDFSAFDWSFGPAGQPCLHGCLATFHCDTFAVHPAGDHTVILGRVTQASATEDGAAGLVFEQGRFGTFTPDP